MWGDTWRLSLRRMSVVVTAVDTHTHTHIVNALVPTVTHLWCRLRTTLCCCSLSSLTVLSNAFTPNKKKKGILITFCSIPFPLISHSLVIIDRPFHLWKHIFLLCNHYITLAISCSCRNYIFSTLSHQQQFHFNITLAPVFHNLIMNTLPDESILFFM